jgi:hypothetical protein
LEVVKRAWPKHDWTAQLTPAVIKDIQSKANFLQQNGFIQNKVNAYEIVDLSFSQPIGQALVRQGEMTAFSPEFSAVTFLFAHSQFRWAD